MAFDKKKAKDSGSGPGSRSFRRFEARRDSSGFPWHSCPGNLLLAAMDCATKNNAAVMWGSAQGGRGVVVTIFHNDERIKEYAATVGEFAEICIAIIDELAPQPAEWYAAYSIDPEADYGA